MQTDDVAPGLSSVGSANHYAGRHGGKHREAQELFSTQNPTKPSIILRPTSSTYSDLRIRRAEVLPGPSPDNLVPLAPDWWMLSARWNSLSQVCGCNALQLFLTPLWSAGACWSFEPNSLDLSRFTKRIFIVQSIPACLVPHSTLYLEHIVSPQGTDRNATPVIHLTISHH